MAVSQCIAQTHSGYSALWIFICTGERSGYSQRHTLTYLPTFSNLVKSEGQGFEKKFVNSGNVLKFHLNDIKSCFGRTSAFFFFFCHMLTHHWCGSSLMKLNNL